MRVFDGKPNDPTFVFVRGNEKNPLKDESIAPAFPRLFGEIACSVKPVQLPRSVWYPGSADFVRDDIQYRVIVRFGSFRGFAGGFIH